MNKADLGSTIVGGGAGLGFLMTVDWSDVIGGNTTKLAVALFLIVFGALLYRNKKGNSNELDKGSSGEGSGVLQERAG